MFVCANSSQGDSRDNLEFVEEGSELLYHANGLDVFSGKAIELFV